MKPQKMQAVGWLLSAAVLVAGLIFLTAGVSSRLRGPTPESELIVSTGPARDVSVSTVRSSKQSVDYLWFTVNGHRVVYTSDRTGYAQLGEAVTAGAPITVGFSAKRETVSPHQGRVDLYTLAVGADVIRTYRDTVTEDYRGANAALVWGGVLTAIAAFGLSACYRRRNSPLGAGGP